MLRNSSKNDKRKGKKKIMNKRNIAQYFSLSTVRDDSQTGCKKREENTDELHYLMKTEISNCVNTKRCRTLHL